VTHVPRKRYGQHFLHDRGVIAKIVAAVDPQPGDAIVEVGPGTGALTAPLLDRLTHLEAVEIDRDLAARLEAGLNWDLIDLFVQDGELVFERAAVATTASA